jgi:hypothetical protein
MPDKAPDFDFSDFLDPLRASAHPRDPEDAARRRIEVVGHFVRFRPLPPGPYRQGDLRVEATWSAPLTMRVERWESCEVLRFSGQPGVEEAYEIDADFAQGLSGEERFPQRLYVCSGMPGVRNDCWVDVVEVAAYLREHRPHLFPARMASPGI